MDPKQIGNLIHELRIKNNLTQKELADKLLVTSQAISKWENGRGIPDIELLQKLSEIFDIDIAELLSGKINKKQKVLKKKKILIGITIGIILILSLLVTIRLLKIDSGIEDFKISKLASDNDSFHIKGIIAYSNNKKSIYISKVDYSNQEEQKKYLELECVLYENNGTIEKRISQCKSKKSNSNQIYTLSELLEEIEFNVDDYSCSCDVPACKNLYLKINAINQNKETITYNIPIELDKNCDILD